MKSFWLVRYCFLNLVIQMNSKQVQQYQFVTVSRLFLTMSMIFCVHFVKLFIVLITCLERKQIWNRIISGIMSTFYYRISSLISRGFKATKFVLKWGGRLMAASSEKPKYFSGILFVKMSADDRGIHNASCENRTPSQVWHQLIFPEAVSTGHSIYNAYIIGDHV